jgi:outer membrane receptor protein involved in Fe transport
MANKRFVFILLSLFIFPFFTYAQSGDSTITINVKDTNGAAIAGATAILTGRNLLARTSVTGSDGVARFENVPASDYQVSVNASGFPAIIRDIAKDDGRNPIEIVLSPGGISENVTVTATRTQVSTDDTAVPVSVIGREEIERKALNTIGDIFRTLPGTSTSNEGRVYAGWTATVYLS